MTEWNESELFHELPDIAEKLHEDGFHPVLAKDVEVDQRIAFLPTMFGFPTTEKYLSARVLEVTVNDFEVFIRHDDRSHGGGGTTDDEMEVWVKDA